MGIRKYFNLFPLIQLSCLVVLFLLSVYIRSSNFNQPLGRHHEWITAHTLVTLNIWEHGGGPENYHCAPVYTFDEAGNKGNAILGGVVDKKGDAYYVSYPPFAFILPYYTFKITGSSMSAASLQKFGIALHFFAAFLFFIFILQLAGKSILRDVYLPAWIGFSLYVFSTGNLWFHSNIYFVDVLMQFFFIAQLLLYFTVIRHSGKVNRWMLLLTFGITFLAIYTEWLGLLAAFIFGIYCLYFYFLKKQRAFIVVMIILVVATITSLGCTLYQYSSIDGWDAFAEASLEKYKMRSGHSGVEASEYGFSLNNSESYSYLKGHFNTNYLPVINTLGIFGVLFLLISLWKRDTFFTPAQLSVLLFVVSSLLLHYYLFFNFNVVHDFGTLKSGILLFLIIVFISDRLLHFSAHHYPKLILPIALFLTVFISFKLFQSAEMYSEQHGADKITYYNLNAGNAMQKYASPEDWVFTDIPITPECIYYGRRNYHSKKNITDAIGLLREHQYKQGIFIYTSGTQEVKSVYRITLEGDSTLLN